MKLGPALASSIEVEDLGNFIDDTDWDFTQKLDGTRLMVVCTDNHIVGLNRRRTIPVDPRILKIVKSFNNTLIFDGEMLDGTYWLFDLPLLEGFCDATTPYWKRREVLSAVEETLRVAGIQEIQVLPNYWDSKDKEDLQHWCSQNGTEGIILKRKDSPYSHDARTKDWLKAKYTKTCEAFVLETNLDGKRNASIGVYDQNSNIIEICTISLTEKMLNTIRVGDCLEVTYLYASDIQKLVQPRFLRLRKDRDPENCLVDQLQFTSKSILFQLQREGAI